MKVLMLPAHSTRERNPYTWLLATALERLGVDITEFRSMLQVLSADIVHLHWPEEFLNKRSFWRFLRALTALVGTLVLCRLRRVPVVWTVHNLHPHEDRRPLMTRWFYRLFPGLVDGAIFLSETSRVEAAAAGLGQPRVTAVIEHGHYRDVLQPLPGRQEAAVRLDLPPASQRVLFFGALRPYKNVLELTRAFPRSGAAMLYVVGSAETHPEIASEILEVAGQNPSVVPVLRWVESDELVLWLQACDLAILPFRDVMHSGSVLMALSAGLPVAASDRGALRELQSMVGEDWLHLLAERPLADTLEGVLEWGRRERCAPPRLEHLGWEQIGEATLATYREVLSHRSSSSVEG